MPELPDITVYIEGLERLIAGRTLERVRLKSPFLLRSVSPSIREVEGKTVTGLSRMGKRIVIELDGELFLVLHLMIAGRLRFHEAGSGLPGKIGLAAFDFSNGSLVLTEAASRRRASLHVVGGRDGLRQHDPGGLEVLEASPEDFRRVLAGESHTLKRALTDPRLFSGIGNAYSDEILHRARLSPFKLSGKLDDEETSRLFEAARGVLSEWIERLRKEAGTGLPDKVTAFREEMAVHGKYGQPCPRCASSVQRVVYSENEANYCAGCQTGGRLLADRALSRLLRRDWPRTIEELEQRKRE